jgi:hypothetical protein
MATTARPIPSFESEAEERRFWESHDSTVYVDWTSAKSVRLPALRPSTISLRLPVSLLERIKVAAHKREVTLPVAEKLDATERPFDDPADAGLASSTSGGRRHADACLANLSIRHSANETAPRLMASSLEKRHPLAPARPTRYKRLRTHPR